MGWKLVVACAAAVALGLPAVAQVPSIELDGSLGSTDPVPVVENPDGSRDYTITDDLGAYSDGNDNLFHSFRIFGIEADDSAAFTAGLAPERVVARVTGGERSVIAGLLRSDIPGADLYLLNPSGVTLEDGGRVQIDGGSFFASSAHVLRFEDNVNLLTGNADPPLLSVMAPSSFGFLPAEETNRVIVARTQNLFVDPGETLGFVGADDIGDGVELTGALLTPDNIFAPGATVALASAGADAAVNIPVDIASLDPMGVAPGTLGGVNIGPNVQVRVNGTAAAPAGRIVIRGERFTLNRSTLEARNGSDLDALGAIDIAVSDTIDILQGSTVSTWAAAQGASGGISMRGQSVTVTGTTANPTQVRTVATSGGDGALLEIDAEAVRFEGATTVRSLVTSAGAPGGIEITAGEFHMDGGAIVQSQPLGAATAGGGIHVTANTAYLAGGSQINSQPSGNAVGGDITLDVYGLELKEGSQIGSLNGGGAQGGAIRVMPLDPDAPAVGGHITVTDGSQIVSRADGDGPGGLIHLETDALEVTDAGRVITEANAGGDGGPLGVTSASIRVSNETDRPEGTFIASIASDTVDAPPPGEEPVKGGDVTLRAQTIDLVGGGQVFTTTDGLGDAGSLFVLDADVVRAVGRDAIGSPSGFTTRALENAMGDGGLLSLETRALFVGNGAQLSTATFGLGEAGNLVATASESITVEGGESGPSIISAASIVNATNPVIVGDGGDLTLTAKKIMLVNGGQVTASASGTGSAGALLASADDISIDGVDPATGFNASGFFSRSNTIGVANGGDGGDLTLLAARNISISNLGQVSVSTTGGGNAGAILMKAGKTVSMGSGGSITAFSQDPGSGGDGGSITVKAQNMFMTGKSEVAARSQGLGIAGNIDLAMSERFEARDSMIDTEATASTGGRVSVVAGKSVYMKDAEIATSVFDGNGGGGDITVRGEFVTLDGSSIIARADEGPGGNIQITSDSFLSSTPLIVNGVTRVAGTGAPTVIDATSNLGIDGRVEINAPDTDLISKIERLPAAFLDASSLLASACAARTEREGSFTVVQRETLPAPPGDALPSPGGEASDTRPIGGCPIAEETP